MPTEVIALLQSENPKNSKITFALASFGQKMPLLDMAMRMKKSLAASYSVRVANTKNDNIHSAVFKKERLAKTENEFALLKAGEDFYLARTTACQDIDAYTRRDLGKNRDMIVGMMPPKLVQMMMNLLSEKSLENGIYDPFCGLGTTLIEAANRGIYTVYGSDISEEMVANTRESFSDFVKTETEWQNKIRSLGGVPNKDFSQIYSDIFTLDATKISEAFTLKNISPTINIVTEGYLGKMLRKDEITQDIVFSERRKIVRMYESFFAELKKANFRGEMVMSFPFWKVRNVFVFIENIVEIIEKNGFTVKNLLPRELNLNTKNGSLLYRRDSQHVGREIIKIVKK